MLILLYSSISKTLAKRPLKNLDRNWIRILGVVLNKSLKQHPTKQQLYGHLPLIKQTSQVRRIRHSGHYWQNKDKLISDVLLWTPTHGHTSIGRPAKTYKHQLCAGTGCSLEDLLGAMDNRDGWLERESHRNPRNRHDLMTTNEIVAHSFALLCLFHLFLWWLYLNQRKLLALFSVYKPNWQFCGFRQTWYYTLYCSVWTTTKNNIKWNYFTSSNVILELEVQFLRLNIFVRVPIRKLS